MTTPKQTELEKRIAKIEAWIDFWEKYDSGWNKYRHPARKAKKTKRIGKKNA